MDIDRFSSDEETPLFKSNIVELPLHDSVMMQKKSVKRKASMLSLPVSKKLSSFEDDISTDLLSFDQLDNEDDIQISNSPQQVENQETTDACTVVSLIIHSCHCIVLIF